MRGRLPPALSGFIMFTLKQGWAAIFGILLLGGLIVTGWIWQPGWGLARYDALLAYALMLQVLLLASGMESWREVRVILLFHLTGTAMEIFKVQAGSWAYPGAGLIKVYEVPLFSGFMYAAVGSYMARVIRLFDMQFAPYPPFWASVLLAIAIYGNFFAHHFLPDIRLGLFAATVLLFARTRIWFRIGECYYWMPLPLAAFFSSFFLWLAENVGTSTKTWLYNGQSSADWVSLAKMGSWYLLLYVSFVTVTLVFREALSPAAVPARHLAGARL
ncbi:DUF817 domain-containing protein [Leisingera thetidis]|uniref:DUF817 domain-containing protein n=1 Tax=Leisingera thetidis TaxID=2930199 RepID=UPI0021F72CD2|nr:DUF817 domain-containing protein [Leisingera thetidis]